MAPDMHRADFSVELRIKRDTFSDDHGIGSLQKMGDSLATEYNEYFYSLIYNCTGNTVSYQVWGSLTIIGVMPCTISFEKL